MSLENILLELTKDGVMFPDLDVTSDENGEVTIRIPSSTSTRALQPPPQQTTFIEPQLIHCPLAYRPSVPFVTSSTDRSREIPCDVAFQGDYGFRVDFPPRPGKPSKSTKWTYSPQLKKLFAQIFEFWPIIFVTDAVPPPDSIIRSLVRFQSAEHVREIISRCPNHIKQDETSDPECKEHVIHCNNGNAIYTTCPLTGHNCCTVKFRPNQEQQSWLFRETFSLNCFSSCVGSLNRRPVVMIFTLENNGTVLGRQSFSTRICACPGRDRLCEEGRDTADKSKAAQTPAPLKDQKQTINETDDGPREGPFFLEVKTWRMYKLLKKMKSGLELAERAGLKRKKPDSSSSSDSDHFENPKQLRSEDIRFCLRRTVTCPAVMEDAQRRGIQTSVIKAVTASKSTRPSDNDTKDGGVRHSDIAQHSI